MWTYMMAAARGDRATSMLSSRRRNENDSPRFSRTFPYGLNRSSRFGTGNFCNSNYHHPYNTGSNQIFHTNYTPSSSSSSHPITTAIPSTSTSSSTRNYDENTKLFSPLSINDENELMLSKKSLSNHFKNKSSSESFVTTSLTEGKLLVSKSTKPTTATTTVTITTATATTSETKKLKCNEPTTTLTKAPVAKIADGAFPHGGGGGGGGSVINNLMSGMVHDDDDGYPSENILEDGKHNQQETQTRSKPSTLRRTLNALRYRIAKRGRTKPPDWFLDKFSNATDGKISGDVPSQEITNNRLCNRLSVDPSLPSHYRWLAVVSLAVLYNVIFVVGRAVFWEINRKASPLWWFLDYLCDFIYLTDTLVHMHEGYLEQGLLVRDAYKLRKHYFSTKSWRLDVLSMFPTDLIYIWWHPSSCNATVPCPVIVRLNRLLRLPRMWEWFDRTETATGYPNAFRICKVVLAILVLIHWNACMYFAISYALGFGTDNWVYNLNGTRNATLSRQYIYSFYWSTLTLTTIGETPTPENDAEYLFVVTDFLAGVLIFATIVGNIGSMISNMNVARVEFQNRMDGVKQYMAFRKVGHELEARVIRWFAYTWSQSGALDEERVLAALPDKLKAEIAIRVHMDTLKQVRIFQDCEPGLLEALVLKLKLQVFSPGDYICRKGDVGKEMYIVKRGRLSVVADDGVTVLATLGAGSVFGEVSVLEIAGNRTGNRRTANVRSLGYSDLFCLAKRDLWETLADYPEARASLTERGCQLLRKDGLLDEEIFASAQHVQDSLENGVQKLEQTVESLNLRLARLLVEYSASQAKLKQRIAKLELLSAVSSTLNNPEDDIMNNRKCPRTGRLLYSLQAKRKRSRITSATSNLTKQNTL